jgi:putative tricarboxylic transport membrane protein
LAKLGMAGQAIGLCTTVSFVGAVFGIVVLAIVGPAVSEIALLFAPRDYLLLALLGILLIGSQSGESLAKGVLAGAFGVMVGSVGLDPMTAQPRLTFGTTNMMGGIHFVAAMIGFFGISETMVRLLDLDKKFVIPNIDRILPSWNVLLRHLPLAVRSAAIGVAIGALPGAGGEIAATTAYGHAARSAKSPSRPFGAGAVEGIIAPQAACNAAIGSAYIPMLTLGIPGDAVTAVLIGALYIHGLKPGPMLMIESPHLFWFTVGNLLLAAVFTLGFGLTGIRAFARTVERPPALLLPIIIILAVVGTYSIQNSISDVFWTLGLGIVGYFLKRYGYQIGPVIIGCILGPIIDMNFRRAIISVQESPVNLALDFVSYPITLILTISVIALLVTRTPQWRRYAERRRRHTEAKTSC